MSLCYTALFPQFWGFLLQVKFYIQHVFLNKYNKLYQFRNIFFSLSVLRKMDNIVVLMLHCETSGAVFSLGCKMTTWLFPRVCFLHTRFLHHSLSLWLPLLFKVGCRLFWSCSTAVILSPLIKFTRKGTSSWLYCYLVCFLMVWFSACDKVMFAGGTANTACCLDSG